MVHSLRPIGAVALGALAAGPLAAQRNAPATYAITNARLVPVSGPVIERGTIVVRDGLIVALGANQAVPADARVIDGVGLSVYPGFIDAHGTLGIPALPAGAGAAARPAAPNSSYPVGLQPEMRVLDQLRADEAGFASAHAAGITAALTAQGAGVFRGASAVISLGGDNVAAMVVKAPIAQHVGFSIGGGGGARSGYPGSLMGVFAALRQELLDAQAYRAEQAAYTSSNARGIRRPDRDPSLEALQPILSREMPVVFFANSQREIERALDLAQEFKLRAMIAGGTEAWRVADRLKRENVAVLLSVNFPRRTTAPAPEADPDPIRVLRERVDAPKGPGVLADGGVRFAFQSGATAALGEFLPNVRRAIDNGLSPDLALRALTLGSAEILGVADRLGSLEAGKIANLTVTRGDVFSRDARVTQVFVDGRPFVIPEPATPATAGGTRGGAPAVQTRSATGTWTVNVEIDGTTHAVTLALRQDGDKLTGTMQGAMGSGEIQNGSIGTDGEFRFTATITIRDGTEEGVFVGLLDGNALRGGVSIVGHALGRFSGTRPDANAPAATPRRSSTR
ncbi:MAG: amidohydrolase family protein [Gemmatimonadales bacterium]|nr:amidohydrolase family protein [Gemmatimonadales bacterium]